MPTFRRARGTLLRLTRARPAAVIVGVTLATGAAVLMLGDYSWESWLTDGLGLVLGGTGVALVVIGIGGQRPDWVDPDGR